MRKLTTATGVGIATVALSFALVGCGSATKTEEKKTETTSSKTESATSSATTTSKAEKSGLTSPEETGTHRTIQDYVKENKIQETIIRRGDPGPTVDLPVPDGWEVKDGLPEAPYGAIVFSGSKVPANPPRILAIFEKLTGNVDPKEILALAPGELQNFPGFDGPEEGKPSTLGGFEAVELGGDYAADGQKGKIGQKTVVIPAADGLYVLQLNAYSSESEAEILAEAADIVDEKTTITP
ncbi:MAG: LpqN/LpqT family lipoprotein [Mycobacteriaceae bacterium]